MRFLKLRSPRVLALAAAAVSGAATAHCPGAKEAVHRLPPAASCTVEEAGKSHIRTHEAEGGLLLEVPADIESRLSGPLATHKVADDAEEASAA